MRGPATATGLLAAAILLASCGGGGGSSSTASASGKPATPREAFRCLQDAGLRVTSSPPSNDSIVSMLAIDAAKPTQVLLWFMKSPQAAKRYATDAASFLSNAGGNADVVAKKVVIGSSAKTADDELSQIEECATS